MNMKNFKQTEIKEKFKTMKHSLHRISDIKLNLIYYF